MKHFITPAFATIIAITTGAFHVTMPTVLKLDDPEGYYAGQTNHQLSTSNINCKIICQESALRSLDEDKPNNIDTEPETPRPQPLPYPTYTNVLDAAPDRFAVLVPIWLKASWVPQDILTLTGKHTTTR